MRARVYAWVRDEVPAAELEAFRAAGAAAYACLLDVEQRRQHLFARGDSIWTAGPAVQAQFLSAWCASTLQVLGDLCLDVDYRADPDTVGYVSPAIRWQTMAFYQRVEPWVVRAREAAVNPGYRLEELLLPDDLPPWADFDPAPDIHLEAMVAAARVMGERATAALFDLERDVPAGQEPSRDRARQLLEGANARTESALFLHSGQVASPQVRERIERSLRAALARYHHVGQLAAMPALIERYREPEAAIALHEPAAAVPRWSVADIDIWCLTDPAARTRWQGDEAAVATLVSLWAADPDPGATRAIQRQIDTARQRGEIEYATHPRGDRLGHFFHCPWSPIYRAAHAITIGGTPIERGQLFTFDVSDDTEWCGGFTRQLLVGDFQPTHPAGFRIG